MAKTFISCSHAGGQGKTTVSQLMYMLNKQQGSSLKLWSADYMDEEGLSKLGRLFQGKVVELGVGASIASLRGSEDQSASIKYWDKIGHALLNDGGVFDVGANVIEQIVDWAKVRRAKTVLADRHAPEMVATLVCKAERRAISDMSDLVRQFGVENVLPVSRIVVVMNEAGGSFDRLALEDSLKMIHTTVPLDYFVMPACRSEMWTAMEANFVSIERALGMSPDQAATELDLDPFEAVSAVDDLHDWVETCKTRLKELNVL